MHEVGGRHMLLVDVTSYFMDRLQFPSLSQGENTGGGFSTAQGQLCTICIASQYKLWPLSVCWPIRGVLKQNPSFSPWIRDRQAELYVHTPSADLGWSPLHLLMSFLKCTRAALFPWPQKGGSQERFHHSRAMNKMTMEVESFIKKKTSLITLCASAKLDRLHTRVKWWLWQQHGTVAMVCGTMPSLSAPLSEGFYLHLKMVPAGLPCCSAPLYELHNAGDPSSVLSHCSHAHRGVGSTTQENSYFPTGDSSAAFPASLPVFHVLNLTHAATVCVFTQSVYKYTLPSFQPLFISRDVGPLKKILFFASST